MGGTLHVFLLCPECRKIVKDIYEHRPTGGSVVREALAPCPGCRGNKRRMR